jgi:pimeloyl-ACP methyl ester carboxylesterase
MYSEVPNSEYTVLHLHGTGGSFYWNNFYPAISKEVNKARFSYLMTNSRGSGVYESENGDFPKGISLEIFEDCLKDIDAWIAFALSHGTKYFILEGHSFGIGKATYYHAKGKYKDLIKGIIFLGTNGVFQTQQSYLRKKKVDPKIYLGEAQKLLDSNQPAALLKDPWALAGYYPASAQTYINFFKPGSEMFRSTQMASKEKGGYRHLIKVPLLWILGDDSTREYLFVPFKEAFGLIKKENPQVEIRQLLNCDHGLNGHEVETASLIFDFLKKLKLD